MAEKMEVWSVEEDFSDGSLNEFWKALGYGPFWKAFKIRRIPRALLLRCRQSGAKLVPAEDWMTEDIFHPETPAVILSNDEINDQYRKRFEKDTWRRVMYVGTGGEESSLREQNFSDGSLREWFSPLDMEPWLGLFEVVELPRSLIERCISSGAVFHDPDEEFDNQQYQHRHTVRRDAYKAELAAKRKAEAEREAKQRERAEKFLRIEVLSGRLLENGRGKKSTDAITRELDILWDEVTA